MAKKQLLFGALAVFALGTVILIRLFWKIDPAVENAEIGKPVRVIDTHGGWYGHHPLPPPYPTTPGVIGPGQPHFTDVASASGLHYRWRMTGAHPLDILQTIGNGCALLDYDGDGNLDILMVGPDLALYRGDGHGHFTDVTHATRLDQFHGHFLGCAVGDYDNDGYDDIYLSGYREGLLLHNEHGRSFRDATPGSGLGPVHWGTSCAWGDFDGDGRLDLYVGGYVQFDPAISRRLCKSDDHAVACTPGAYHGDPGFLYHNEGNGRFRDVTQEWKATSLGKTLGAAFADYNGSGRQSLMVSNDTVFAELFQNQGKKFVNVGQESATAFDGHLQVHAGMGLDWGDYDNDGRLDLTSMAFHGEPKCVYHNLGSGIFQEISDSLLLTPHTLPYVAFGVKWLDYDNDGWLDLMISNGHVYDNVRDIDSTQTFRQPTELFHNDHGQQFLDVSTRSGADLQKPIVGRGLAIGDFDNDGRIDALVVDSDGSPLLLHNETGNAGHFLSIKLVGTRSNRDGYGALVTIKTPGLTQTRLCHSDGSYLSSSDSRVHVGLGAARSAQSIAVHWASGHVDTLYHIAADRFIVVREGSGIVPKLPAASGK